MAEMKNTNRASQVTISLSHKGWKGFQSLIRAVCQQAENPQYLNWVNNIFKEIDAQIDNFTKTDQPTISVTLPASKWRGFIPLLKSTKPVFKKDDFKQAKEDASNLLSNELNKAQYRVIVTTSDLHEPYQIVGPVYFQVSNKGILSNDLSRLTNYYHAELQELKTKGQARDPSMDWGFLYGEWSAGQSYFERAFFIAIMEIKKRAFLLDADAVICMRQDIDLDTAAFQFFYLQMYGTAIRMLDIQAA